MGLIAASNVLKPELRERLEKVSRLDIFVSPLSAVYQSKINPTIKLPEFPWVKYGENEIRNL
jgi:hypothetical protein